jgi:hypothetical protein
LLVRGIDFDLERFSRYQPRQRERPLTGEEGNGGPALIVAIMGLARELDVARRRLGDGDGLSPLGLPKRGGLRTGVPCGIGFSLA